MLSRTWLSPHLRHYLLGASWAHRESCHAKNIWDGCFPKKNTLSLPWEGPKAQHQSPHPHCIMAFVLVFSGTSLIHLCLSLSFLCLSEQVSRLLISSLCTCSWGQICFSGQSLPLSVPLSVVWLVLTSLMVHLPTFSVSRLVRFPYNFIVCLETCCVCVLTDTVLFPVLHKTGEVRGIMGGREQGRPEMNRAWNKDVFGENGIELSFLPPICMSHWVSISQPHTGADGGDSVGPCLGGSLIPGLVLTMGLVFGSIWGCTLVLCRPWKPESAISLPWRSFCSLAARGSLPSLRKV